MVLNVHLAHVYYFERQTNQMWKLYSDVVLIRTA